MTSDKDDLGNRLPERAHDSDSSARTSLSTLDRARASDPRAWERLVGLYSPMILGWCKRSGLQDQDTADIAQEVWVVVSKALSQFQKEQLGATFRGWLWTITRNKLRDYFRRQRAALSTQPDSWVLNAIPEVPDEQPPDSADDPGGGTAGLLRRAMTIIREDFEERTWQAFWLSTVENLPAAEVAARLSTTRDAVYQAKARVMHRLRDEVGELS